MQVTAARGNGKMQHVIRIGKHQLLTDISEALGGEDTGPEPHDILAAALAACTALTVRLYAARKGMSWIAWAWWTPPPVSDTYTAAQRQFDVCKFPALITDWNGTPSPSGKIIKARLATIGTGG